MTPSKLTSALILGLLLIGSAARVVHPLKATSLPAGSTINAPTAPSELPKTTVIIGAKEFNVEIASTDLQKAQGLSDRAKLGDKNGMLFVFNPPSAPDFWMKDMHFDLDIIWIANNKIVKIDRRVPAPKTGTALNNLPSYPAPGSIDYVLEVNAGAASTLQIGDIVTIAKSI